MERLFPARCIKCGKKFHSARNPATYCTGRCRQQAYRDGDFTPHVAPVQEARNKKKTRKRAAGKKTAPKRKPNAATSRKRGMIDT